MVTVSSIHQESRCMACVPTENASRQNRLGSGLIEGHYVDGLCPHRQAETLTESHSERRAISTFNPTSIASVTDLSIDVRHSGWGGDRPSRPERRCHQSQLPRWPILNLGMLFSTKCNGGINLRAMVSSISQ
jgi:hypothetical protein